MMLVAPMMQLIILPLVANFDVKNINLVYIDHDQSPYSHELIQKITASGYFKLVDAPFSYKKGIALIEDGKADVVWKYPKVLSATSYVKESNLSVSLLMPLTGVSRR